MKRREEMMKRYEALEYENMRLEAKDRWNEEDWKHHYRLFREMKEMKREIEEMR